MIDNILQDLLNSVNGSRAVIFLDGDGESIAHAGNHDADLKLQGAWKEIHFGHIRDITERLGLGSVKAVLFSLEEGNELIVPVGGQYCLLLFLSPFASLQEALGRLADTVQQLKKQIE